jgi:hypothetical protein
MLCAFQGFHVPSGGKKTSQDVKFIFAQLLVALIEEGDKEKMRTGIDILFDNVKAEGIAKTAE